MVYLFIYLLQKIACTEEFCLWDFILPSPCTVSSLRWLDGVMSEILCVRYLTKVLVQSSKRKKKEFLLLSAEGSLGPGMVAHSCYLSYPGVYSWETTRAQDVDQPGQHSEMISQRQEKATVPKD